MKTELGRKVTLNETKQNIETFDFSIPHECRNCPHPIEPYLGLFPSEVMKEGYGLLLKIPRINLFGTQTAEEYIGNKSRSVQKKLSKCCKRA